VIRVKIINNCVKTAIDDNQFHVPLLVVRLGLGFGDGVIAPSLLPRIEADTDILSLLLRKGDAGTLFVSCSLAGTGFDLPKHTSFKASKPFKTPIPLPRLELAGLYIHKPESILYF